jgi:CheY-like chemotaxis protein/Flp pilus assembly protein TadD
MQVYSTRFIFPGEHVNILMDPPLFSVLFVDDEPALLEIFSLMAERSREVKMQTASSAKDGLRLLKEQAFDAIIVDYDMPEINGIQFLKILRSSGNTTPVILYTGAGREHTAIEALNNGANFYLKKSEDARMQFRDLVTMVRTAVEGSYLGKPVGTTQRIIADMINFASDPTFAIDKEGIVLAWNDAMEQLTDVPASAIVGKGDLVYAEPFFGTKRKMLINLIFESDDEIREQQYMLVNRVPKGPVIAVTRGKKRDGSEWTIWTKAMPIFDGQGDFIAAVGTVRDVTATFSDVVIRETAGVAKRETPAEEQKKPAGRLFDKILCKAPADYRKGVVLMVNEKKYREAIEAFDRALKINEKFAQAWNDRGVCYRQLNDYTSALKSCLRAVELDSENPDLLFTLGTTLEQIGVLYKSTRYLDSAVQVFKMVISQLPNNMDAWNHLGVCYKEMGKEEEAKFHFDRARDIKFSKKDTPVVSRRNEYL